MIESVFEAYGEIYRNILNNIYPAKNSTGFPERNLSVNFTKAYEAFAAQKGQNAFSWFEFQFGNSNNLHVDAVLINKTTHELYVIESKRFSNPMPKMREIGEDIDRVYSLVEELRQENLQDKFRIKLDDFEHKYGVILADVWTETPLKEEILQAYKEGTLLDRYADEIKHEREIDPVSYYVQNFCDNVDVQRYNLVSFMWELR